MMKILTRPLSLTCGGCVSVVAFSGATLTISGSSFGASTADNTVTIGGVACTVTSASSTQLVCTVGAGTGSHDVEVNVVGVGLASGTFSFTYNTQITGISPFSGSLAGLYMSKLQMNHYIACRKALFRKNYASSLIY